MANSGWSWHLFAAPAIWIAKLRGIPVIVNYRGGEADVFFDRAFSSVRPSLSRADAIIVPSGFLEAVFAKRGFSTRIVPNIIDLSRFQAETRPYALGTEGIPAPYRYPQPGAYLRQRHRLARVQHRPPRLPRGATDPGRYRDRSGPRWKSSRKGWG